MKPRLQALLPVLFYLSALFLDHHLFPPAAQYSQYAAGDQQNDIDGVLPFIALERSAYKMSRQNVQKIWYKNVH